MFFPVVKWRLGKLFSCGALMREAASGLRTHYCTVPQWLLCNLAAAAAMARVLATQSLGLSRFECRQEARISSVSTADVSCSGSFRLFAGASAHVELNLKRLRITNQSQRNRSVSVEGHRGQWSKRRAQVDQATGDLAMEDTNEDDETCEIVSRFNVTLGEGSNTFLGYMVQAIKNNNGAVLLFLTDVMGFEDRDTRDFAYRLACFGYNVLVPDLFRGAPWVKERPLDEYEEWRAQHEPDRVAGDIDVATKWLANEFPGGELGVIGFCFGGGRLIEALARDDENLFSAAAFCYGTRFDTSIVPKIQIPLLVIAGDGDDLCPVSTVREVEQSAKEGTKVKIYPGFGHAFVHRPETAEADEIAEDAFAEIRHWFHEALLVKTE